MTDPVDRLKSYAEDLADAVSPARSQVAAMRAIGSAGRNRRRRVPQMAFAGLAVVVAANLGTAAVADSAVPGDLLYPVDRAYERAVDLVGLGGDRHQERLDEAAVLADRGDLVAAVDHLATSIADPAVADAATELLALGEDDPEFPTHVTALLEGVRILTAATSEGDTQTAREARAAVRLLGTQVAEEARQRPNESGSGENNGPPDHAGPPEDVPTGPPEDVPGATAPGQVDPPSGSSEDGGPPDHAGPPDNAGPPDGRPNPGGGNQSGPPATTPSGQSPPAQGGPPADEDGNQGSEQSGPGAGSDVPPGQGNPGQGNPGQGNPGQGNPGQGNPGQGNPGQGNPGQGNPGQGNPGQGNPGQGNPGQGNSGRGGEGKP